MLTTTGAAVGVWRGIPCLAGIALGMGLLMFSVALGLGHLVLGHPLAARTLNWIGACFLLWLAWKIAFSGPGTDRAAKKPVGFGEALLFQWVNPKSWLVSTSAAGAYLQAGSDDALLQSVWFAALFVMAALPSSLVWLAV